MKFPSSTLLIIVICHTRMWHIKITLWKVKFFHIQQSQNNIIKKNVTIEEAIVRKERLGGFIPALRIGRSCVGFQYSLKRLHF